MDNDTFLWIKRSPAASGARSGWVEVSLDVVHQYIVRRASLQQERETFPHCSPHWLQRCLDGFDGGGPVLAFTAHAAASSPALTRGARWSRHRTPARPPSGVSPVAAVDRSEHRTRPHPQDARTHRPRRLGQPITRLDRAASREDEERARFLMPAATRHRADRTCKPVVALAIKGPTSPQ